MEYLLRQAVDLDIDFLLNLRDITMGKYLKDCGMHRTKDAYLSRILYEFEHAKIIEVAGSSAGLFKANLTKIPTNGILFKFKSIQITKTKR